MFHENIHLCFQAILNAGKVQSLTLNSSLVQHLVIVKNTCQCLTCIEQTQMSKSIDHVTQVSQPKLTDSPVLGVHPLLSLLKRMARSVLLRIVKNSMGALSAILGQCRTLPTQLKTLANAGAPLALTCLWVFIMQNFQTG